MHPLQVRCMGTTCLGRHHVPRGSQAVVPGARGVPGAVAPQWPPRATFLPPAPLRPTPRSHPCIPRMPLRARRTCVPRQRHLAGELAPLLLPGGIGGQRENQRTHVSTQ